jgi:hypothetical protein
MTKFTILIRKATGDYIWRDRVRTGEFYVAKIISSQWTVSATSSSRALSDEGRMDLPGSWTKKNVAEYLKDNWGWGSEIYWKG